MTIIDRTPVPLNRRNAALRTGIPCDPGPIRMVHVGLGAFHRAHQAWYTDAVDHDNAWGIRAFTGRSPDAAAELAQQEGLYSLVVRSARGDSVSVIDSIAEAVDIARTDVLTESLAAEETRLVTLTITEAGYRLDARGRPNLDDEDVAADVALLQSTFKSKRLDALTSPRTALARILIGLEERRRRGAPGLAVISCDNLPANGDRLRTGLRTLADLAGAPVTADYIHEVTSFVTTSVDRITPKSTAADRETVGRLGGWIDVAPVVTEPFHDWVLQGTFPRGRPAWEEAGAKFVDDIEPFERRKLWLLNGAHSLLAYAGIARGHESVSEAVADPLIRGWVEEFWDEAVRHLPADGLDLPSYRAALLERFENGNIRHLLRQIGQDGTTKLHVRIAPVVLAERAAGRDGEGAARVLGAWAALALKGGLPADRSASGLDDAIRGSDPVRFLLRLVDEQLADDEAVVSATRSAAADLTSR